MYGERHTVSGAGGVRIGLLTAGTGQPLLLIHGGMGCIDSWEAIWSVLVKFWRVTAMDRRGRGSSGDADPYAIDQEYDDIATVATKLADLHGAPIDVFAHSYGATCTLGAAASGAPFRRLALYEPAGPQAAPKTWLRSATAMVTSGRPGQAMSSFLTEIIGLSSDQVQELRVAPRAYDALEIVSATLPREGRALTSVDLLANAQLVTSPARLLLGDRSPAWASEITHLLSAALADASLTILPGQGHEAIQLAPELIVRTLQRFFADDTLLTRA